MAALDCNRPRAAVRADTLDAEAVEPAGELVGHGRDEPLPLAVRLDAEKNANEEDRRARCPGLRARGSRIRDRERRLVARVAGEDLRQRPVEVRGRLDQSPPDAPRPATCP